MKLKTPNPESFRSNPDLIATMENLITFLKEKDSASGNKLISQLVKVPVQQASTELQEVFLRAFRLIVESPFDSKILSGLISLAQHFVSFENYHNLKSLLEKVDKSEDNRVRANALLTRAHFETEITLDIATLKKTSNR